MASFTDTQLPKFNPYIAQQPIEAMVAVGTQKQKAHDEGVQKIQAQIDNISGLQVGRDVDKAYLQSKINELGNDLRSVAAGDFSNFQLVNSTGGMIKQIGNDPFIRAGVAATANDNKQIEMMEEDRKKGTLTPHSEYFYSLKRNKYYSNNSLKGEDGKPINYSGKYIQSWDIDKQLIEAIKGVGDSKMSYTQIFEIDPATGQIAKDKRTGAPIYSSYATKMIKEGKFSENVAGAIDTVLMRPEAKQELTMRGVYNYRGINDVDTLMEEYNRSTTNRIGQLNNQKEDLQAKSLGLYGAKDAASIAARAELEKKITSIDAEVHSLENQTELQTNAAKEFGNIEALKGTLENMKVRNNYMISGVTEKIQQEIVENIPYNKAQEKIAADRKWYMDQQANTLAWNKDLREEKKLPYEIDKLKAEIAATNAKVPAVLPPGTTVLESAYTENDNDKVYLDVEQRFKTDSDEYNKAKFAFLADYSSVVDQKAGGKKRTREQIIQDLKRYSEKDAKYLDAKYQKALEAVNNNPKNPLFRNLTAKTINLNNLGEKVMQNDVSRDRAKVKAGKDDKGIDVSLLSKDLNTLETFEVTYRPTNYFSSPITAKVTPKDLLDIQLGLKNNTSHLFGLFSSDAENAKYEAAEARILEKYKISPTRLNDILSGNRGGGIIESSPQISKYNKAAKQVGGVISSEKFTRTVDAMGKAYREIAIKNQDYIKDPLFGLKASDAVPVNSAISTLILNNSQFSGVEDSDLKTLMGKGGKIVVKTTGGYYDDTPKYHLGYSDGNTFKELFEITSTDAQYINAGNIPQTGNISAVSRRVKERDGLTSNLRSEDISDPNNYMGALVKETDFAKKFHTTIVKGADVWRDGRGELGKYNAVFYVKTNEGIIPTPYIKPGEIYPETYNSPDEAEMFIKQGLRDREDLNIIINLAH